MYPVLMVKELSAMTSFYVQSLNMEITFESDWYVSLKTQGKGETFQLALLQFDHETIPKGYRKPSQGVLLNWEVDNADLLYERLIFRSKGVVHLDIRDEPWGQRHFITSDPEGNLLDIIQIIEPSPDFLAQYTDGVQ
jgi:catechol 2,3-dioxygenase-like lactoylglutathione lyase family enzyme